jgi:transcriptional regulator with XRE-family HTH domain
MTYLPSNLRYLRKKYDVSNREIAEMLGKKTQGTIIKWENSETEPPLSDVIRLAELYHVSIDELVYVDLPDFYDISSESMENSIEKHKEIILEIEKEIMEGKSKQTNNPDVPLDKIRRMYYLQLYKDLMKDGNIKPYLLIEFSQIAIDVIRRLVKK